MKKSFVTVCVECSSTTIFLASSYEKFVKQAKLANWSEWGINHGICSKCEDELKTKALNFNELLYTAGYRGTLSEKIEQASKALKKVHILAKIISDEGEPDQDLFESLVSPLPLLALEDIDEESE